MGLHEHDHPDAADYATLIRPTLSELSLYRIGSYFLSVQQIIHACVTIHA